MANIDYATGLELVGHKADPLAGSQLDTANFLDHRRAWSSRQERRLLEGGYDLEALAACAKAHVEAYQAL